MGVTLVEYWKRTSAACQQHSSHFQGLFTTAVKSYYMQGIPGLVRNKLDTRCRPSCNTHTTHQWNVITLFDPATLIIAVRHSKDARAPQGGRRPEGPVHEASEL